MKKRKSMACLITALVACSAVFSVAARQDEITLVMVPREEETLRVGMDLANKYPTLLISYQLGVNHAVSLHGWTGSQWVNVKVDDFQSGAFFKKGPDSALIVEKAGVTVPEKVLPPSDWCASVAKIRTTEMRPLLHLVGQYYDLSYKDWQWFSKRYGMDLDAINPEGLNVAWYHRRMEDNLKARGQQSGSDLQYWVLVRYPVADEPVVALEEQGAETAAPPAEEEPVPAVEGTCNPLTNDAPAAVVMGVADADEEHLDTPAVGAEEAVESKGNEADVDETAESESLTEEAEEPAPGDEVTVEDEGDTETSMPEAEEAVMENAQDDGEEM